MINFMCKFLIFGILGLASTYASGYDEYLKELGELKNLSEELRAKKPEMSADFKSEYNALAREVNKYIDYFILIIDKKTTFNLSEIDSMIKSINLKAEKLKNRMINMGKAFCSAPAIIGFTYLFIKTAKLAYDFIKELKDDYEKRKIIKELESYQWEKIE